MHDVESPYCAQVGHHIVSAHAVYCHHEQAWTLHWSLLEDSGADGVAPEVLQSGSTRLGPFDVTSDALALLCNALEVILPLATA